MQVLKHFDLFRVVQDKERHLTPQTSHGAIISSIAAATMVLLTIHELVYFFSPEVHSSLFVVQSELKTEPAHFNVSFPAIHCHHLVVEIFDPQTGQPLPDLMGSIKETRMRLLKDTTVPIGPFLGSRGDEEGCQISGSLLVTKVPGNFFIAARRDPPPQAPRADHIIHELWFGEERLDKKHDNVDEDLVNALAGVTHRGDASHTIYQYFLQIVPTYFRDERTDDITKVGYQYTASFSQAVADGLAPGLYFRHQHAPLAVEFRYRYQTWSHFLVHLSAIVGGVFTVIGFSVPAVEFAQKRFGLGGGCGSGSS